MIANTNIASSRKEMPQNLAEFLAEDMRAVEGLLGHMDASAPPLMDVMVHHVMEAGGKRVRPLLTLATANLFGNVTSVTHSLASAIEFIHTATLLHDDVMDDATMRRHVETSHTRFGNVMSILFGDFLLALSFQRMLAKNDTRVMHVMSQTCAAMAKGEIRQLTTRHQWQLSQTTYEQTIGEKTASLFGAACQLGGISKDVPDPMLQNLRSLGENIGMAFQIIDDIMDYTYADTGKTPGSDFFDGKVTLPVILSVKQNIDVDFWHNVFSQEERDQTDFATAVACLQTHKMLDQSRLIAHQYMQKALNDLDTLPKESTVWLHLRDFVVSLGQHLT